ncbi:MAG TPA: alpha/beta fold hydrolase, partial [Myxococcaceae bacterium]|nr:alpha/beta fold hydrolase [Myxococcaceae bacterium]
RDEFLRRYAQTRRFQSGRPVGLKFTPDGKVLLFLRSPPISTVQSLYAFDVATGATRELLTADSILRGAAQELTAEEKARLERMRSTARGIIGYALSEDGKQLIIALSGRLYRIERASGRATELRTGEGAAIDPRFSPDGRLVSYVRGGDLYVLEVKAQRERRLTRGGGGDVSNGLAEFVAQEEMHRFIGYWWSPDSKAIAFERSDTTKVEKLAIVDPTHPERGAHLFPYPRPGKANAEVRLGIVPVGGGRTTWVQWDAARYPYLATVTWPKKGPLTILVQNRHQTEELLLAVDARTGRTRTLLQEEDAAWLNLQQSFPHWLEDGSGFLWFTERNGAPEVELRAPDGTCVSIVVPASAGYEAFIGYDDKRGWLYFTGSPNPTESVLHRVKVGAAPERVKTDESGPALQSAVMSKDGQVLAVATTTLRYMPRVTVWRADGTRVGEVPSVAQEPPLAVSTELRKVGPGEGFHAAWLRPRGFQKGKKYPVVVEVYGGPHHLEVKHSLREDLLTQWIADHGFIVVKADNRGTPRRGRAWERAIKHDLGGVTLDDQVAALRALAAEVPEMDLSRVGILGWSYGGYMAALALMRYPEVFKAGVAGAPVTEWRDYDTHYTERYMGLPQEREDAYQRASVLTHAKNLSGALLLVHGTADDNVYFFHTLKLSDALFREGKPHGLLPLSDFTHMVADPLVTERLQQRVVDHLRDALRP